ncbi:MAG TPA: hypothetical protein VHM48_11270 [Candidatus Limnocylindrales bacterium]|nr:hypothetical protein [Candidatus Limnocylindrales bacterium]
MSARLTGFAALAASVVIVVGCGSSPAASSASPASTPGSSAPASAPRSGPPSASPSASPSAATATVLLKVTSEGGFINPSANLNALPIVEVLSDGRILTVGPVDAIAPAPLLPTVQVRATGAAGAAAILAAIRQAGLDQRSTAGPGIPGDSGTDIFSVTVDGETTETRLAGAGLGVGGPGGPGLGGSADPGKAAAFDLLNKLLDPAETWGGGAIQPSSYAPTGYRVFVIPGAPSVDPATPQTPVAWPLSTALDAFGTAAAPDRGIAGLRQGAVLGPDAVTLGPILARATVETAFTSGGKSFTLAVRPLLPDELGG